MLATNTTNNRLNLGYKKTKLGWIPNEWSIEMLEAIAKVVMGQSPKGNSYNENKKGVPLINGPTEFTNRYPVEKQWTTKPTKLSEKGDILICVRGSSTGRINISNGQYCIGRGVAAIRSTIKSDQRFIEYQLYYQLPRLLKLTSGSTFPNINSKNIKRLRIPTPPLPEQKKIAEILSTWDEAISTLERLIEKKEELKKGLMQQLLTGKKRFRGFEGEWKEVKIGTLGKTFNGLSGKSKNDFGFGKPYIPYKNVFENSVTDTNNLDYVNIKDGESQKKVEYGDIFFTVSSETPDEVGMTSVLLSQIQETYLNSFCFGFRLNDFNLLLPEFAARYFRSSYIRSSITKLAQGSTRYNLTKRFVLEIKINLPSVAEQKAIAGVFNELEKEITLLSKRSASYTEQKKGLMQQLLTGKRRVRVV